MKGSELIKEVQSLIDEFGDCDIGINNQEFDSFDRVSQVYYRKAYISNSIHSSDSVGDAAYFIAIE